MTSRDDASFGVTPPNYDGQLSTGAPPTYAAFSPVTLSANTPSRSSRRSTILVHQKSPLLLATPPQITRALAYSHPFILPLNTLAGLLTWSSGDSWQSFLLVCAFWAIVLYGDMIVRWAGPVVVGAGLIAGMYGRRYSPLSSSGWTEPAKDGASRTAGTGAAGGANQAKGNKTNTSEKQSKHTRGNSEVTNTKHQKTLDEIVETLKELTGRCNVLLEPLLEMTDFLSTQRTPTSATTRPALTALFMRLLIVTPFWVALAAPPWRLISTRRVVLVGGTVVLTWHSRVMRVSRAILWRSATARRLAAVITGLEFEKPFKIDQNGGDFTATISGGKRVRVQSNNISELTKAFRSHTRSGSEKTAGVKFTFIIYENQRRWIGLGWTNSLFAYERPAWTDEHNNPVPPKDEFELPVVEDGSNVQWKWAPGSRWRVDGVPDDHGLVDYDGDVGKNGWVYYDNKWANGRRGQDGWGRWTRRRKWYRDAELVEVDETTKAHELDAAVPKAAPSSSDLLTRYSTTGEKMITPSMRSEPALPLLDHTTAGSLPHSIDDATLSKMAEDSASLASTSSKSWAFRPPSLRRRLTDRSSVDKDQKQRARRTSEVFSEEDDSVSGFGIEVEMEIQKQGRDGGQWGIGDEARMNLE